MAVKGFSCYETYYQIAECLESEKQRGLYWIAIMDYMFRDIDREPSLPKNVKIAFINAKSHLKTSMRQSENGSKAKGKPKQSQTEAKTKQVKDKVKVKDKDKAEDESQAAFGIPEDAKAALIDLGLLRGEAHAE